MEQDRHPENLLPERAVSNVNFDVDDCSVTLVEARAMNAFVPHFTNFRLLLLRPNAVHHVQQTASCEAFPEFRSICSSFRALRS